MLKIILKIVLVILIAAGLSFGLDHLYRIHYGLSYDLPKGVFPLPEVKDKYELVSLGNSHSQDGLTFKGYKIRSLSLASVAQSYEYDFAQLRMHENQIGKGAVIIIVVSPISFSQNKASDNKTTVNSLYYDGRLSPFLIPHLRLSDYLQKQFFPFARAGFLWRQRYAMDSEKKGFGTFVEKFEKNEVKPTPTPTPTPPPAAPPTKTQPKSTANPVKKPIYTGDPDYYVPFIETELKNKPFITDPNFTQSVNFMVNKWYRSGDFGKSYFETNAQDLEEIIKYSLNHGWRPVLVTLPISDALLDSLGRNYLKDYMYDPLKKADTKGIPYINLGEDKRITKFKDFFQNSDHLNREGAALVSYQLLQKLIQLGYLPKSADGYQY